MIKNETVTHTKKCNNLQQYTATGFVWLFQDDISSNLTIQCLL